MIKKVSIVLLCFLSQTTVPALPSLVDTYPPSDQNQKNLEQAMAKAEPMMINIIKKAIDQNKINEVNEEGLTLLHLAIVMNSIDGAKLLIQHKAELNLQDVDGQTPLYKASRDSRQPILQILLEAGASVNISDKRGYSPLHLAKTTECAKLLINHHANVNSKSFDGTTPLHLAVIQQNESLVIILLENGANVDVENNAGFTPIHFSFQGPKNITNLLIAKSKQA